MSVQATITSPLHTVTPEPGSLNAISSLESPQESEAMRVLI